MFRAGLLSLILGFGAAGPTLAADVYPDEPFVFSMGPIVCQPTMSVVSAAGSDENTGQVIFPKIQALGLLAAFEDLTDRKSTIPAIAISGLTMSYTKGADFVIVGIVVGEDVCQKISVNPELANAMLDYGREI